MHRSYLSPPPVITMLILLILLHLCSIAAAQDPPVLDDTPAGAAPAADEGEAQSTVLLQRSFEVPASDDGGEPATHTPAVIFTADGKRMITATSVGEVLTFDRKSQELLSRFKLPKKVTSAISIDPQARLVVAAVNRGVVVHDVPGAQQLTLNKSLRVQCVAIAPDARSVAISRGRRLELRSLPKLGRLFAIPGHESRITNVAWSSDGRLLGSTAEDGRLLVYDVAARRPRYTTKKEHALHALAFHPQGTFVAYGGVDRQVYQYELETGKETVISDDQPYWITCLGYSPDGKLIAVGDESCDIWLYERETQKLLFHNKHHDECWLSCVSWAPDNETFVFGCHPNAHADAPSVYGPLVGAEAAQAKDVSSQRDLLIKKIDAQLAEEQDEEQRASLKAYRESLVAATKPINFAASAIGSGVAFGGGYGMGGGMGMGGMGGALGGSGYSGGLSTSISAEPSLSDPSAAELDNLPAELKQVAEQYQQALQKEVNRLGQHHRINQWKIER